MVEFFDGALTAGFLVVTLFFLRFWRRTGDRLFGLFAFAFSLMALHRIMLGILDPSENGYPYVYGVRLLANLVIMYGIVDKNRRPEVGREEPGGS